MRWMHLVPCVLLVAGTTLAEAGRRGGGGGGGGRLSKVGKSLRSSSGSGTRSSSGGTSVSGGSRGSSTSRSDSSSVYGREGLYRRYPRTYDLSFGALFGGVPRPTVTPLNADFYAGAQKLVESDRAMTGEARLRAGDVGIGGRFTQFQEPNSDPRMTTPLRLNLWQATVSYRFRPTGSFEIEPEFGVAGLKFWGDGLMPLTEQGPTGGISLRARIAEHTALVGGPRFYGFADAGVAIEARVGVAVGPVQVSYRYLKFDESPALEGPEAGLGFRF